MSVVSLLSIGLIGWFIYRVLHPHQLELSPATLSLSWVLGTGVVYLIYYLFIAFIGQNPPPLLILTLAGLSAGDCIRHRHHITVTGWRALHDAKFATVAVAVIAVMMGVNILMSGFYADTTRMWMAKGDMLNQQPDYIALMESLPEPRHPDYPMVMSHQYQWQLLWSDNWVSLKLSTVAWYLALLLAGWALLDRTTHHPMRWLILLAGYPAYWFVVPIATVDIPLSVMMLVAVHWTTRYQQQQNASLWVVAFIGATLTLTKNEGILLLVCLMGGFVVTAGLHPVDRRRALTVALTLLLAGVTAFVSWYSLVVGQATISVGSDFALSGFRPEAIPQVLAIILPILFDPLQTAGLWLIFVGFIIVGDRQHTPIWVTVLLYGVIISASYTFSVRPTSLTEHIVQSYFRLLLQVTPLALIFVAHNFTPATDVTKED